MDLSLILDQAYSKQLTLFLMFLIVKCYLGLKQIVFSFDNKHLIKLTRSR